MPPLPGRHDPVENPMNRKNKKDGLLRKKAEKKLSGRPAAAEPAGSEDTKALIHELQVHQTELEMQNDELRNAQMEIEESRSRYADLYDFSPVGYFTFTSAGAVEGVNLTGARLLGMRREKLVNRIFATFVAPDERILFRDHCRKVLQSGRKERCELKLENKVGTTSHVSLESIRTRKQDRFSIRSAVSDITDRVDAEQERLRLLSAVEQATESMAIIDLAGTILYVNRAFETLDGRPRKGLVGESFFGLILEETADAKCLKSMQEAIGRGERWSGHLKRKLKDRVLDLGVILSPVRDAAGKIISYLVVSSDVTRETALREHALRVQKMETLGTLAGGIAHELNNLLGPIMVNTEMALLDIPAGTPMNQSLVTVLDASRRARELVRQILTFAARRESKRKPVELGPIIRESLTFLRASIPSAVEIRQEIETDLGVVLADPTQIHQIMANLAGNAAHAMKENGGILHVRLAGIKVDEAMAAEQPELKPGRYMRLAVSDTGHGMSREVMERIFDPFFTTKKQWQGTGTGLSIVRGIVKSYDGGITVQSEEGKGTTFEIFFPTITADEQKTAYSHPAILGSLRRVLVIDDDKIQCQTWGNALERLGYSVTLKTDSEDALSLFRSHPEQFDLVVTDQVMPGVAGLELAEEVLRARPDMPILLCTGFTDAVSEERAKALGIRELLQKPVGIRELAEAIDRTLDKDEKPGNP
jgi:PAS domain S-box-containing protein